MSDVIKLDDMTIQPRFDRSLKPIHPAIGVDVEASHRGCRAETDRKFD